ncbi:phosphatase PAP2 family protein [Bifidobacterium mongoliense]|uniref:phosphatase PAP2 family protein n=1 Tax=Bifidobacterium mongoliense TaxID=518643 RepID=UPI0030ECB413
MGEWFWDGLVIDPSTKTRALQQTFTLLNDMVKYIPVTDAKRAYNYPRPSLNTEYGDAFDRSVHGSNDLKGLAPALGIKRASDWTDPYRGFEHGAGYAEMIPDNSQSFPSGHTMAFYASGLTLAAMVPELSTQIAARAAEGGNDRIVLGVHYPLDIIGGRIVGTASAAGVWGMISSIRHVFFLRSRSCERI